MDNMDSVFPTDASVEVDNDKQKNEEKKQQINQMKEALREEIQTSPDFQARLHRLTNSIKVVNTLGAYMGGNIVEDKSSTADKRVLKPITKNVGYRLQNIGSEAIEYTTEEYTKDEAGVWVGTKVRKTFAPGEQIDLTRQYMTMFCAQPEISFTLSNGKIMASSKKNPRNIQEELSSYYFKFDDDQIKVNDDEVKLSVVDENNVVKPEFEKTFGFINNPKAAKASGRVANGQKNTIQDAVANWVNKRIQENGL